jgi:hypothetical protein
MPKKYKRRGGGIFDNLGQTFSNWGTSISQGAQGLYNKAKQGISGQTTSTAYMPTYTSSTPAPINTTPQPNYQSNYQPTYQTSNTSNYGNYGGTKKKNRKNKRGGYRDNVSLTNLASHAAPFSGNTAEPHNWVGGKTNRRRKSGSKTKKRHHKSKRH